MPDDIFPPLLDCFFFLKNTNTKVVGCQMRIYNISSKKTKNHGKLNFLEQFCILVDNKKTESRFELFFYFHIRICEKSLNLDPVIVLIIMDFH